MKKLVFIFVVVASLLSLASCASSDTEQQQRRLELIASNRASVLSSELPIEYGPLTIMQAKAVGSTIQISMVYNPDAKGAKPFQEIQKDTVNSYCVNPDIERNLKVGISYRVQMRNSRGQLVVDQMINQETCQAPVKK